MKISIIYHSETGNTKRVAEIIAQGAELSEKIEVKCMSIEDMDNDFLDQSKAVFFGCPVYCGNFSWQMKKWLDITKNKLAGKLGAVFATENHLGGGADLAELSIIGSLLVYGMLVYSAGTCEGNPFTHFGSVCIKDGDEKQKERAKIFGKRIAKKAVELFGD